MCGIIGSVLYNNQNDKDLSNLKKGINSLIHRGPDSQSFHVMNNVAFGHTRLSIIDLNSISSTQPKILNDKMLIFNGEIYNYKELSRELILDGVKHNPISDTDVLFNCILNWGIEKTLNKIDGMYAFAYWDSSKLWLVRDKIGEKFLYWTLNENGFYFSSEIKGIFKLTNKSKKVNIDKINEYFYSNFISGESTIYSEIYSINPGNYLVYDFKNKTNKFFEYWNLSETLKNKSKNNIIEDFDFEFKKAMNSRYIADVEIGLLGSGGVDSQSIIQHISSKNNSMINIFFGNNDDNPNIEKELLNECLSMQKNNFPETTFKFNEIQNNLSEYLHHLNICSKFFDEPLVYESSPQSAQISKLARSIDVKVLVSGEGADEIFFGYERMVRSIKKLENINSFDEKFNYLYFGSNLDNKNVIDNLFNHKCNKIEDSNVYSNLLKNKKLENFDLILFFFQKYRLQTHLNRLDITGSMNGVEYRCPFLSPNLISFINRIDNDLKYNINNNITKEILRKYLKNKIPSNTIDRKIKNGWNLNMIDLFKHKNKYLKDYLYNLISNKNSFSKNYLNFHSILNLFNDHYNEKIIKPNLLWNILNLELWFKNSFNNDQL